MITKMWETVNSFIPQFIHNRRQKINYISATQRQMPHSTLIYQPIQTQKTNGSKSNQTQGEAGETNGDSQVLKIDETIIIIDEDKKNQTRVFDKDIQNIEISTQSKNKQRERKSYKKDDDRSRQEKKEASMDQLSEDMVFSFKQLQQALDKIDQAYQPINQYNLSALKTEVQLQREVYTRIQRAEKDNQTITKSDTYALVKQYKQTIEDLRNIKYKSQLINYPLINLQEFIFIIEEVWRKSKNKQQTKLLKDGKVNKYQLTYRDLAKISPGSWLNDNITVSYIAMMNEQLQKQNSKYTILDSLFSANMFGKQKSQELILRSLKRKNITHQQVILIAINTGNHWFFIKIYDQRIHVYDSLKCDAKLYAEKYKIIHNIINFANWYYSPNFHPRDKKFQIQVHQQYPQQTNGYDCGIFMCFGIKDVIRGFQEQWSFGQKDCKYKRIQLAWELINEKITGFL